MGVFREQHVVLVLGAGASQAYGFPLGRPLSDSIRSGLANERHPLQRSSRNVGFDDTLVTEFSREFRDSGRYSIDAFLQSRPEYLELGKFAIAATLVPFEHDDNLFPAEENKEDWYRYLLNQILPGSPDAFHENRIAVVTFNFDRSFERRLFLAVKATYQVQDEAASELARRLPVVHVHGSLGLASWSGATGSQSRDYVPEASNERLLEVSQQIRLVGESAPDPFDQPWEPLIHAATEVHFLGFSYHELNLRRLDVSRRLQGKRVLGTRLGMSLGEVRPVSRAFRQTGIDLAGQEVPILEYLRHVRFLHGD